MANCAAYVSHCQVCGRPTPHRQVYRKWSYPILACLHCGLGSTRLSPDFNPALFYDHGYFSGLQVDGYADYPGSESVLRREFRHVLRTLFRSGSKGGKLLEVGCAYGFFLSEASAYYQCVGVEIAPAVGGCLRA
jgi:hypothetical protein